MGGGFEVVVVVVAAMVLGCFSGVLGGGGGFFSGVVLEASRRAFWFESMDVAVDGCKGSASEEASYNID